MISFLSSFLSRSASCEEPASPASPLPGYAYNPALLTGLPASGLTLPTSTTTTPITPLPSLTQPARTLAKVKRPPSWEHFNREARSLTNLDVHDGLRVEISKALSPYFLVSHNFHLGSMMYQTGYNYTFMTQFVKQPFMMGRFDLSKRFDGRCHFDLGKGANLKLQSGMGGEGAEVFAADLEQSGADFVANYKVDQNLGLGLAYTQYVSPSLALGGELKVTPSKTESDITYGFRYNKGSHVVTGTLTSGAFSVFELAYVRGFKRESQAMEGLPDKYTFISHVQGNAKTGTMIASAGVDCVLLTTRIQALLSSNGQLQALIQENMGAMMINFSAHLDHIKQDYKFGMGFTIGGQ